MIAYELLARLRLLVLAGQDEDGDLEWIGKWQNIEREEEIILREYDACSI
jgi:hypothetical protein